MSTHPTLPPRSRDAQLTLHQALIEADRCLLCHDAPCSSACPGGTDPARFIRQLRFYNLRGAARTVLRNNPLGGVCARVCPTGETCVGACLRTGIDRPIDISGLQRFAVEYGRQLGVTTPARDAPQGRKVGIVGAGPAGLTVAALLAEQGYEVTVFEARDELGGMLRYGIPAARLDEATLAADLGAIRQLGVTFRAGAPIEGQDGARRLLDQGFDAVFVAPGLWRPLRLDLPGAELAGVTTALDFLAAARSAPQQAAALVGGENVAVIGGGSVAMDVATTARRLDGKRIYVIALEGMTELPAQPEELAEAAALGVILKPQCQVTRVLGESGRVVGVEGHETEWIVPGQLLPQNARPLPGTSFTLRVGAVVQAIGQGPTQAVAGLLATATRRGALLQVDPSTQATTVERVFAGGDYARGAGTVIAAVGDGKRAARAIHELLTSEEAGR